MDQSMLDMMPIISIGFFVLMAIIIIPLVIRKTRKARVNANRFFPELAQKTGLQLNGSGLSGNYKGYQVSLNYELNVNAMAAYKTLATGKSNIYGKNAMFPTLHISVMSDMSFPQLAMYDPPGILSHTSQFIQDIFTGTKPGWTKLSINANNFKKGIDFYGDEQTANKLVQSHELKMLLANWKYTDIRMQGNSCILVLDNNSAPSTIGIQKMYTHAFAIQALDIAVAAATAAQN